MGYINIAILVLFLSGITIMVYSAIKDNKVTKLKLEKRECKSYAVLIPARDESKVITGLLDSIKRQGTNFSDVYIIVESMKDKTCSIAEKFGTNLVLRKDLSKRRKAYALDDAIEEILSKKHYDLYFIFDADNVLADGFVESQINIYNKGYDIGVGYRNIKNSKNVVAVCSGLTFSMINTLINNLRNRFHKTVIISGTGYYIAGKLIESWQGFPFTSLTEDYELTLYASANKISTWYNSKAMFYDEQPTSFKVSITQRTRWVKGFFEARKKRLKHVKGEYAKIFGVMPYLLLIGSVTLALIYMLYKLVLELIKGNTLFLNYLLYMLLTILFVYLVLAVFTIVMLVREKGKLDVSKKLKVQAVLFNPIFLASYIHCLIKAIFTTVTWDRIEHKG